MSYVNHCLSNKGTERDGGHLFLKRQIDHTMYCTFCSILSMTSCLLELIIQIYKPCTNLSWFYLLSY